MALPATIVWEVRTSGASTAGGGWNTAGTGVDYSQQDAAQYALTGLTSAGAGDTLLSAAAAEDMVGNVAQAISGTNITAGFYEVISVVVGVSITFGTNNSGGSIASGIASSGVVNIGGALSLPAAPALQAGHKVWIKATGIYNIGSAQAIFNTSGTVGAYIVHEGYTTVRGDGGQVVIARSTGSSYTMLSGSGSFRHVKNLIASGGGAASMTGFGPTGSHIIIENCGALSCTTGFSATSGNRSSFVNCVADTCGTGFNASSNMVVLRGCTADSCTVVGFSVNVNNSQAIALFVFCIAVDNTGPGFRAMNAQTIGMINCVSYQNSGDGVLFDTTSTATAANSGFILNCIFVNNGGYGMNANGLNLPIFSTDYNAFYNNTGGARNNLPAGPSDVSLTGSPFTDADGGDFSLNDTAGAGAECRAVGWPGELQRGGTGYLDIGTLQHQDAGGGGMIMSRVRTVM